MKAHAVELELGPLYHVHLCMNSSPRLHHIRVRLDPVKLTPKHTPLPDIFNVVYACSDDRRYRFVFRFIFSIQGSGFSSNVRPARVLLPHSPSRQGVAQAFPSPMASIPVLNPSELKAHLGLLRAFHDLERRVKDGSKLESEVYAFSPEERWESFVQASVERCVVCEPVPRGAPTSHCCRFHTWVSSLKVDGNDIVERVECPSLDVCLVWHAYMLNPR